MRWKWNRNRKKSDNSYTFSEQYRAEKLYELGLQLNQFRQEKSLSLEQIAIKTRISKRYLKAIEQGNLEQLPEPVYVQGFIKRFADTLGLNGTQFAAAFPTGANLRAVKSSWRDLPAAQLRPIHLYLLYVLLIFGAVSGLSYMLNRPVVQQATPAGADNAATQPDLPTASTRQQERPRSATKNQTARSNSVAQGTVKPGPAAADSIDGQNDFSTSNKPVRVDVELSAQSWIRIVVDGKTEFEGVLPEGTQRHWEANENLVLRAGNAGGVLVTFNDSQTEQLGDPGTVKEVKFEADSNNS